MEEEKIGRPTVRTPTTASKILSALEMGMTRTAAAGAAGISYDTLKRMTVDDPQFEELCKQAEARFEARMTVTVFQGALYDPKLALEVLGRRRPVDWAKVQKIRVSDLTDEQLKSLLEADAGGGSEEAGASDTAEEPGEDG